MSKSWMLRALLIVLGLPAVAQARRQSSPAHQPTADRFVFAGATPRGYGIQESSPRAAAASDPLLSGFYPRPLAENAVAALQPERLSWYLEQNEAEKAGFLRRNFPLIFRWDLSPENRRRIVSAAGPNLLPEYDALATEDLQIQFCFKRFGPSGVVMPLAPSIRRQTLNLLRKESGMDQTVEFDVQNYEKGIKAYKKATKKTNRPEIDLPDKDTSTFLFALGLEIEKYQGQHVYNPAEVRARGMVPFMVAQVPFLGGSLAGAALEGLLASNNRDQGSDRSRNQTARTIIAEVARASHMNDSQIADLINRFDHGQPIDQARVLLPQAMTAIQTAAGPSPVLQAIALGEPGPEILSMMDRQKAAHWNQMTFDQKCLELRNFQGLIMWAAADMVSEDEETAVNAYNRWEPFIAVIARHDSTDVLARRYFAADFGQPGDLAHNPTARAAAVFLAVFFVMFQNFFPFTE